MNNHTIIILAFDQTLLSGLTGIVDMLALANISQQYSPDSQHTTDTTPWNPKVIIASNNGKKVIDKHGRALMPDCSIHDIDHCQGVIVPGFTPNANGLPPSQISDESCQGWLKKQYKQNAIIGSSCSGAFVLGEAGLLNNKRCTTTWWLHYELIKRFPKANAAWASPLVDDNRIITAGGPLSWVDIVLTLVRYLAGNSVANRVADYGVIDTSPHSQHKYIDHGYPASAEPFLVDAEHHIRKHIGKTINATTLAAHLAVSERTLNRRLKELCGETPKMLIDRVRMDMAKTMLHTSNQSISQISSALGFSDDTVFRRLFRKQIGMSPSEFRHWKERRER